MGKTQNTKYKIAYNRTNINKHRKRHGYLSGYNLSYLTKIIKLTEKPKSFSILFEKNPCKMKNSFLQYIRFSLKRKLIRKDRVGNYVIYSITNKGKLFLELTTGMKSRK